MKNSTKIQNLFDSIANKYDFLNNLISLGTHKFIKLRAVKKVPLENGAKVLDLCTGTGDIAILFSNLYKKQVRVVGVDFSENMLEIARKRAGSHENIEFLKADALHLPFEDNSFDAVFISFGLRNLNDLNQGIAEMKRVIKPGAYISNLDTGKPKGLIEKAFGLYFFNIVPCIGKIFGKNFSAYKYLPESTKDFPAQELLVESFKQAGFSEVCNYNYLFGSMAQQVAKL